jgi:hypothetical protein
MTTGEERTGEEEREREEYLFIHTWNPYHTRCQLFVK